MTRPLPIVRAGSWYHVVSRGENGSVLFPSQQEAGTFITGLGAVAERCAVEVHAYCIMGNHYHLLARAQGEELLDAVERLEADIAAGPGRVRMRRMVFGRHLLGVTRYIHRNPVEAGFVQCPADWPWSSYRGYLDRLEAPRWLRSDAVLGWFGSIGPRQRYRHYVEGAGTGPDRCRM